MAKYQKPNSINTIWALSALSQDISKPSDSYIQTGWTQVKPPYQFENWSMNKLHQGLAYYNQLGFPEWDQNTEYQASKSYVQASDNRVYRCIQTHSGRDPVAGNSAYWEVYEGNRQATTSTRGTVELATQNEVDAGDRSDVAVTASTLHNKRASQSSYGISRFATNSEVSSGSRDDVALSPATLQFRTATTSQSGLVELATSAEAQAGTRNDVALTPESITGIFEMLFPVGSVVMRPTNPGNSVSNGGLGFGTWEKITGRSIIGDGSHTDSNGQNRNFVAGSSEGTYQHRLSSGEMPSHSHSASSGSAGSHNHTVSGSTDTTGNHSHSASSDSAGYHSHSGSAKGNGAHSHSGSTDWSGNHRHGVPTADVDSNNNYGRLDPATSGTKPNTYTTYAGNHNHSLNINNAGYHGHSLSINGNGSHTHTISVDANGNHSHSVSGITSTDGSHNHSISISSTGGNQYHNNIHPVFVAPIWYRTA